MKHLIALIGILLLGTAAAQRPDSIMYQGKWHYIYPIAEELTPTYHYLKKMDLEAREFEVYRDWKQKGDARADLKWKKMHAALREEIIAQKIMTAEDYDYFCDYRRWIPVSRFYMKRHPEAMAEGRSEILTYDLEPCVYDLPDGLYVQYFDDLYTYRRPWNAKQLEKRVACVFELKNNQLNGAYRRFDYDGDSLRVGNFNDGLRTGTWMVTASHFNRLYRLPFVRRREHGGRYMIADFSENELNGEYRKYNFPGQLLEVGHFEKGHPVGNWTTYWSDKDSIVTTLQAHYSQDTLFSRFIWVEDCSRPYRFRKSGFEIPKRLPYNLDNTINEMYNVFENTSNPASYDLFQETTDGLYRRNLANRSRGFHDFKRVTNGRLDSLIPVAVLRYTSWDEKHKNFNQRYYYDTVAHCILGAQFYDTGAVYDTIGYDKQSGQIYRRIFDQAGRLYRERRWDEQGMLTDDRFTSEGRLWERTVSDRFGNQVSHQLFLKDDESTDFVIDGFATRYFEQGRNQGFKTYYQKDTTIGTRKYFTVQWDKQKVRRYEHYFDTLANEVHENTYDENGKMVFEVVRRMTDSTLSSAAASALSYWNVDKNGFKLRATGRYGSSYHKDVIPALSYGTVPYNGAVTICVRRYSAKYRFPGVAAGKMKVSEYGNYSWNANTGQTFNNLIEEQLDLKISADQIGSVEGQYEQGLPKGTWHFYNKRGREIFKLEYVNGLPSGTVREYDIEYRSNRWDRRSKRWDKNYEDFEPVTNWPTRYLRNEYQLKDGVKNGSYYSFNVNGDTTFKAFYKNGYSHGPHSEKVSEFQSTTNYVDGRRDGHFVYEERIFLSDKDGGHIEVEPLASFDFVRDSLNGRAFYTGNDFKVHADYKMGLISGEIYYVDEDGRAVRKIASNGLLQRKEVLRNDLLSASYDCQPSDSIFAECPLIRSLAYSRYGMTRRGSAYGEDSDAPPTQSVFTKYYPNGQIARTGRLTYAPRNTGGQPGRRGNAYAMEKVYTKHGTWKYYDYDGHILYAIDFKDTTVAVSGRNETMLGVCTTYDTLGKVVSIEFVRSEDEAYNCSQEEYYAIREYVTTAESPGRKNGLVKHYFDNGMLMSEGQMVDGLPTGVWKFYAPDGTLKLVGKYKDGLKEGRWLSGDLSDKAYIGEICVDPDDPNIDVKIANLEREKAIQVFIYKAGEQKNQQFYQTGPNSGSNFGSDEIIRSDIQLR